MLRWSQPGAEGCQGPIVNGTAAGLSRRARDIGTKGRCRPGQKKELGKFPAAALRKFSESGVRSAPNTSGPRGGAGQARKIELGKFPARRT